MCRILIRIEIGTMNLCLTVKVRSLPPFPKLRSYFQTAVFIKDCKYMRQLLPNLVENITREI